MNGKLTGKFSPARPPAHLSDQTAASLPPAVSPVESAGTSALKPLNYTPLSRSSVRPFDFATPAHPPAIPFYDGSSSFTAAHLQDPHAGHFALDPSSGTVSQPDEGDDHARRIAELRDFFVFQYGEFSRHLERQLDTFYGQTASRLDTLAEQIIRHFAEELNAHASHALNALMSDWAEQNRALVDAECHRSLDQFSARLQAVAAAHVENHRREMQNLSSNLKNRLRSVAHALQDVGPASHHS